MAQTTAKHLITGEIGEEIALQYLLKEGFVLLERNFRQKWGEIDLIMQKDTTVYFVEVKAVSYETRANLERGRKGGYRPEEKVTPEKVKKLDRTIQTWLQKENYNGEYQLDVVTVRMVPEQEYALVERIAGVYQ
jgi:putative endonuclease